MPLDGRSLFPWIAGVAILGSIGWALNRGQLPPADFTFINGTEVKSLDPAIVTGQPENRMINALFEGLTSWNPETLKPEPGVAERWDVSADLLTYTFHLRKDAKWSDGSPVTAHDFIYSMRRFLDPRTAAEYSYQAWYVKNAKRYSGGGRAVRPGDNVEVELNVDPAASNALRGELVHGKLVRIEDRSGQELTGEALDKAAADESLKIEDWVFVISTEAGEERFRYADDAAAAENEPAKAERHARQILLDLKDVGMRAIDDYTLEFKLENPTPYFLTLVGFYPLFPVQQKCVETFGSPDWTDVENIVCNGPFKPQFRHLRDRTRVVKNEHYWDRDNVKLGSVDFLAVESSTTALNLYLTGEVDWIYDVPASALRTLMAERPVRDDLNPQPMLNTYFYLLNVKRKPFDDVRVRKALSMAMDRNELTQVLLGAGELPTYSLVPPGLPGYDPPQGPHEDVKEAQRLLAEAGYPNGRGFPEIEILHNTHEGHHAIAQLIRDQWRKNLGISVKTRNEEWATFNASQRQLKYDVSRRGWIGDYADPNTFLDMFVSGGENNCTGWGNAEYDRLIAAAATETDSAKRLELLHQAEAILMDEQPIIPFYNYVSKNMVKPTVRGFYNNIQDTHPLSAIWIDAEEKTPNPFMEGRE
ncbi:peptide ABC transporter substrate-binding protein [Lacipirellula sp.]|uniref:peptide ABC transporter substrate-binding protein n=1 Tax=Lacipirellula sp. TaxID=2691419 RepID=UPI003D0A96E7